MAREDEPNGRSDELEELGDEAIIAHQSAAHLPQKRARVSDEQRSVVIAESAQPGSRPYAADRGEKTLVIRDRRELERTRNKIMRQRRRKGGKRGLWLALGICAVLAGSAALFVSLRSSGRPALGANVSAAQLVAPVKPVPVAPVASAEPAEAPPPKVSLDQLPIERPRHKSQ